MTSAHHMKKHSSSKVSPSSSEHKHSRSKHVCGSKTEVSTKTQSASHALFNQWLLHVYDVLMTIFLHLLFFVLKLMCFSENPSIPREGKSS